MSQQSWSMCNKSIEHLNTIEGDTAHCHSTFAAMFTHLFNVIGITEFRTDGRICCVIDRAATYYALRNYLPKGTDLISESNRMELCNMKTLPIYLSFVLFAVNTCSSTQVR